MKFLSVLILLLGHLTADAKINPLFVSLGYCEVAVKPREHELRTEAFPFDWLLTLNHERFAELLDNDFAFFLDEQYMFQNPENPSYLENKYYEIEFRHDPPSTPVSYLTDHLQEITPKYEKRISQFRQLGNYPGKVFFIRSAYDLQNGGSYYWFQENQKVISEEQAVILKKSLDRFFPSLDFTLVIINYKEENTPSIRNINGIIEFQIRRTNKQKRFPRFIKNIIKKICRII